MGDYTPPADATCSAPGDDVVVEALADTPLAYDTEATADVCLAVDLDNETALALDADLDPATRART